MLYTRIKIPACPLDLAKLLVLQYIIVVENISVLFCHSFYIHEGRIN